MNRLRSAFTIRRRLVAFGFLAVLFALGASYNSLRALRQSAEAGDAAIALTDVQHHHEDAVVQLTTLQGAALEAVLVGQGSMARTPEELDEVMRAAARAHAADQERIAELARDTDLVQPLPDLDDAQDRFVADALRIGDLVPVDPEAAVAALDAFLADAEALFASLAEVSATTGAGVADAAEKAVVAKDDAASRIVLNSAVGTFLIILVTGLVAYSIARQMRQMSSIARAMAAGNLQVRNEINSADELGGLARSFDEMADSFEDLVMRLEMEAAQDAFRRKLFDAFDMAGDEDDVNEIVEEAMGLIDDSPMELLLSDSSQHHVTQSVVHPRAGAPSCPVGSTGQCMAVRRGHRLVFESSGAIDACPHLKRRESPCSAVCVPVTFNGRPLGVIHRTSADGEAAGEHLVDRLAALASQTGARLGTINAFQGAREQATIDGLTGLANRRTLENDVRALSAAGTEYALIMCDLDHFKNVNDHYGHEMGDRALRLFARILRDATRDDDITARLGGEEFVVVQPGMTVDQAVSTVERIQLSLATRVEIGDGAPFTSSFGLGDTTMATDFGEILRIADAGLLAAKDRGRDRWVVGDPQMASELARRGRPRGPSTGLADDEHGPPLLPERI